MYDSVHWTGTISVAASSASHASAHRAHLSSLRVFELWTIRNRMTETATVLTADSATLSCIRVIDRFEEGRNAVARPSVDIIRAEPLDIPLLSFFQQILQIEKRLGRCVHVDEGRSDTRLA